MFLKGTDKMFKMYITKEEDKLNCPLRMFMCTFLALFV